MKAISPFGTGSDVSLMTLRPSRASASILVTVPPSRLSDTRSGIESVAVEGVGGGGGGGGVVVVVCFLLTMIIVMMMIKVMIVQRV